MDDIFAGRYQWRDGHLKLPATSTISFSAAKYPRAFTRKLAQTTSYSIVSSAITVLIVPLGTGFLPLSPLLLGGHFTSLSVEPSCFKIQNFQLWSRRSVELIGRR